MNTQRNKLLPVFVFCFLSVYSFSQTKTAKAGWQSIDPGSSGFKVNTGTGIYQWEGGIHIVPGVIFSSKDNTFRMNMGDIQSHINKNNEIKSKINQALGGAFILPSEGIETKTKQITTIGINVTRKLTSHLQGTFQAGLSKGNISGTFPIVLVGTSGTKAVREGKMNAVLSLQTIELGLNYHLPGRFSPLFIGLSAGKAFGTTSMHNLTIKDIDLNQTQKYKNNYFTKQVIAGALIKNPKGDQRKFIKPMLGVSHYSAKSQASVWTVFCGLSIGLKF